MQIAIIGPGGIGSTSGPELPPVWQRTWAS